jgi:hypothetical protein
MHIFSRQLSRENDYIKSLDLVWARIYLCSFSCSRDAKGVSSGTFMIRKVREQRKVEGNRRRSRPWCSCHTVTELF